jgi:hypothetical protein
MPGSVRSPKPWVRTPNFTPDRPVRPAERWPAQRWAATLIRTEEMTLGRSVRSPRAASRLSESGRFCDSRRGFCLGSDWTTDPCASAIAVNLLREARGFGYDVAGSDLWPVGELRGLSP